MRKNLIAMSAAAFVAGLGFAGGAAADVFLDDSVAIPGTSIGPSDATREEVRNSATGHQLIVPYFNTQVGNATLFNIVNTDTINGKAVKIRFRGASNSDDVFDFQLYMSPGDHWSANISANAAGISTLTTADRSCTIPALVGKDSGGVNSTFVLGRLPTNFLSGDALNAETREGYIEIFNMADVPPFTPDLATGAPTLTPNPLFTATKHVLGVAPCTTTTMATLQENPTTLSAVRRLGFRAPTTGLFANWVIVNVPKAGSASGEAIALTAVIPNIGRGAVNSTPARGNIVFFPQVNGAVSNVDFYTADPALRTVFGAGLSEVQNGAGGAYVNGTLTAPIITAQFFDLPDLSTPYLSTFPATSALAPLAFVNELQLSLATASITNEYLTDTAISAFTDWVFSQPTRRYAVVADYRSAPTIGRAFTLNQFYTAGSTAVNTASGKTHQICASTSSSGVLVYDREEGSVIGSNFVVSPNPPIAQFRLCGETSVLTFNSPSAASVLGASVAATNFSTAARDGWARVDTPGPSGLGLPIVGKAFVAASTRSLNVGASWEHRYQPTRP